eukprot:4966531-Pyramimonas_sp.AAC.1
MSGVAIPGVRVCGYKTGWPHLEGCLWNAPVGDAIGVVAGVIEPFGIQAEGESVRVGLKLTGRAVGEASGRAVTPVITQDNNVTDSVRVGWSLNCTGETSGRPVTPAIPQYNI